MMANIKRLDKDVYQAAQERIAWTFDTFPRIYLSFSGGKDSTVMMHMVCAEARRRGVRIGVLFVDLEGQYKLTIDHVRATLVEYQDCIEPYWICLPIHLRNGVSQYEPQWICWDKSKQDAWIRPMPPEAITEDNAPFDFAWHGMEFEEFVPKFGEWYGGGQLCACLVGIRTDESLNRWRTIAAGRKQCLDGKRYTTWCGGSLFNVYPIYDWRTRDIWIYHAKTGLRHNTLYDRMHQAGLTIHQMRICQPYGDDQRKGLWLFHVIEPETWGMIVNRVNGANQGAMYAQERGNILGVGQISKPDNHTWESYARLLVSSMPPKTREHFQVKVTVFLDWYRVRGYAQGIPDEGPMTKESPSWKRVCKALLRNDYWCKGLSFSQHKSEAYKKYLKLKRSKQLWMI